MNGIYPVIYPVHISMEYILSYILWTYQRNLLSWGDNLATDGHVGCLQPCITGNIITSGELWPWMNPCMGGWTRVSCIITSGELWPWINPCMGGKTRLDLPPRWVLIRESAVVWAMNYNWGRVAMKRDGRGVELGVKQRMVVAVGGWSRGDSESGWLKAGWQWEWVDGLRWGKEGPAKESKRARLKRAREPV